jgi:uncharacterized protein (TIGR03437 family)
MRKTLGLAVLVLAGACSPADGQNTATIDINTNMTTPVHPGFSGVNDEASFPVEYWDYRFTALAATAGYGWIRYPAGDGSDAFNWQTGEEVSAWVNQFSTDTIGQELQNVLLQIEGKGGARLIDAANRANALGASLIICANGFTDTAQSIGQLAAYVNANHIPVAAWELSNEPYLYANFFPTATAYLNEMKPYRDAIKAVDPNAIVAVFASNPSSNDSPAWDQAVAAYPNKYWDAITFHPYPPQSNGALSEWMADESADLAKAISVVTTQLAPLGPAGVQFLVTEFDPSLGLDRSTGATSITNGTLWGGIYTAEYLMRLSTVGSVLFAGPHSIVSYAGVSSTDDHTSDVRNAAEAGETIDTLSLDFGFYVTAQANGMAVLNGVTKRATSYNQTTVTGGATVPATGVAQGIPALYAAAYTSTTGGLSLVITNKSATAHQVTIRVNGAAASGTFPLQSIAGSDPGAANSFENPNNVAMQTGSSANPVTVPPYSVLRVDLVTPAVATVVDSASFRPVALAPQQVATAFGSGIASQTISAAGQPLPVTLGDTTINVVDSAGSVNPAPLYYVSANQANFLIPSGAAPGAGTVKVTRAGATVLTGAINIAAVSPGLYSANGNGAGVAAALAETADASGSLTAPALVFSCQSGVPLSCLSSATSLGAASNTVYVWLFGTGIRGAKNVQAFVAGQSAPVVYAGPQGQYPGLDQVNISLPRSLAGTGEASVYLVADGAVSNMVTLNIQ